MIFRFKLLAIIRTGVPAAPWTSSIQGNVFSDHCSHLFCSIKKKAQLAVLGR